MAKHLLSLPSVRLSDPSPPGQQCWWIITTTVLPAVGKLPWTNPLVLPRIICRIPAWSWKCLPVWPGSEKGQARNRYAPILKTQAWVYRNAEPLSKAISLRDVALLRNHWELALSNTSTFVRAERCQICWWIIRQNCHMQWPPAVLTSF